MRYYPVYLDIRKQKCLVVGGGAVGTRKVLTLLSGGANVTVVSPEATRKLLDLAAENTIELKKRPYRASDLENIFLVIGATDDENLNWQISTDAKRLNKLCNIVDHPEYCNFILPSVVQRGDLMIAISTSGKSPALAKKLRKELETNFGEEYADFLRLMGAIRAKLLSTCNGSESHRSLFETLVNGRLMEMIKNRNKKEIDRLLHEVLGEGYAFDTLMRDYQSESV